MHVGTFSTGIYRIRHINEFLGSKRVTLNPTPYTRPAVNLIIGWGRKARSDNARKTAELNSIPYSTLEDGFIRSIGLGREGKPSVSMVVDPIGIHFDSTRPSHLENILNGDEDVFDKTLLSDARRAIDLIVAHKISKYNGAPEMSADNIAGDGIKILIVDQIADDASIAFGTRFDLNKIISIALEENPSDKIYIKLHPESIAGFRKGIFSEYEGNSRIEFIRDNYNPISVLKHVDKVYVATSQMGFEALMMGKEVICFGMPFYAGWGLTDDRVERCERRQAKRSVEQVFAAAYILYSRYVHPVSGKRCDIFSALEYMIQQLKMESLNRADIYCFGIRHWTRSNINPFLTSTKNKVVFVKSEKEARKSGIKKGDQVVVWGMRRPEGLESLTKLTGNPPISMEDGFLRSVGLGSDFVRPSSLVLDPEGIYFDPSRPSRLESLLMNSEFTSAQLEQASVVRKKIVTSRLTKYNLEPTDRLVTHAQVDQRVILVPGQVEDDASIRLGCEDINTNLKLIQCVRSNNPDAYIIYKPHPDVSSGNRKGKVDPDIASKYCDHYVEKTSIATCLEAVDEVHTMTSLVGFEALMRGIPVTAYGKPFYAGWGLTTDRLEIPRRTRQLALDELVAGTLLLYPIYYDWDSSSFTDCESIIDKLISARDIAEQKTGLSRLQLSYAERQVKKLGMLIKGLVNAP